MAVDLSERVAHTIDTDFARLLNGLQGNILKGHGRDHVANVFMRFTADPAAARAILGPLASRLVTSASQQLSQAEDLKRFGIPGDMFVNVMFTAAGYGALGFSDAELTAAFPEKAEPGVKSNFRAGMRAHFAELGDPDPTQWDAAFNQDIHLLMLLADDDAGFLRRRVRELINELAEVATVVGVEFGAALRDANQEGIEHFGYADGRSQPIFLDGDLSSEGPTTSWDPVEPLDSVLVQDGCVDDPEAFGSYYVFRKLEQNVLGFMTRERDLADALGLAGGERARAGAMAVGRFRDGTPLALSPTAGTEHQNANDFRFDNEEPEKCPFHAHIRKTNPRGDLAKKHGLPENEFERPRRIVRRGIPYGSRARHPHDTQDISQLPSTGVGLLFACFQAGIASQFAFMQAKWANSADFVSLGTGQDPIVANPPPIPVNPQKWPTSWGGANTQPFDFGHFVKMKGGEFFFAPSLAFLQRLAPEP